VRRPPLCPGNIYGEERHPTEIEQDVGRLRQWQRMTASEPSSPEPRRGSSQSSQPRSPENITPPSPEGEIPPPVEESSSGENATESDSNQSQDEVEQSLSLLTQEGGVGLMNYLLAKAITPDSSVLPVSTIREWSFKDLMCLPLHTQKEWLDACRQELDSLLKRDVYDLVDPPPGRRIIKNRWVFDQKTDGRKRARLVAKGFSQVEGIDFNDIFSPVVRYESVHLIVALAALLQWHMSSIDVKTAFLYGVLDEELYMEQPQGFKRKGEEHKVLRLKRALYGLKQAALQWWKALDKSMAAMGFR
jgi:reverse transcriptase-like protein